MGVVLVGKNPGSIRSFVEGNPSYSIRVSLRLFRTEETHKLEGMTAKFAAG